MFAVIETCIDQDSGERGEMCVYHHPDGETAEKVKRAFEKIDLEGITYRVKRVEPDSDFDCPECGEGLERPPAPAGEVVAEIQASQSGPLERKG